MKGPVRTLALMSAVYMVCGSVAMAAEIDTLRQQAGLLALREPTPIMDFELDDLQGRGVKLSSFKGKVFLLNFWATWCEPCRTEIPTMIRLHDKLSRLGFEIVAIDVMESPDTVARYVREARMTFPVLLDNDGKAANTYGARGIPTTYVVDHTGNAVSGVTGAIEWHTPAMEEYLRALLAART